MSVFISDIDTELNFMFNFLDQLSNHHKSKHQCNNASLKC